MLYRAESRRDQLVRLIGVSPSDRPTFPYPAKVTSFNLTPVLDNG